MACGRMRVDSVLPATKRVASYCCMNPIMAGLDEVAALLVFLAKQPEAQKLSGPFRPCARAPSKQTPEPNTGSYPKKN